LRSKLGVLDQLTRMNIVQPSIPVPSATVVLCTSTLGMTLVQDVLECIPANLLGIAPRPLEYSSSRGLPFTIAFVEVGVSANMLAGLV
jgi:hypothetical protein